MQPISRIAELTEDWKHLIRREGIRSALPMVGMEIAHLPFRHLRFCILARSLTERLPDLKPKIVLEIRPFERTDLKWAREIDRPSEARLCAKRLASGYYGLLALHQGQPVGYAWGCLEINPALERVHLHLNPGDVLCTDVYTRVSYRGQGIQTALTLARFQKFRDLGYHRAICYIQMGNIPSLAVWKRKLGAQMEGEIDFLRVGPWYRIAYTHSLASSEIGSACEESSSGLNT